MSRIKEIGKVLDVLVISLIVVYSSLLFIKTRFKIDTSGIITIFAFLVAYILRILNDFLDIRFPLNATLIWVS
jgi:hypothetical protein